MTLFVSANTHQGAECFNTESRGKQCAFMSLSAILTAERIPLFEWSQSTIDNILVQGDYVYVKALNNGIFGINPGIELTSIDNLPRFVEVSCNMNILSFELIDTTVNNINYEDPPVLHAESSNAHINSCDNNVVPVAVHRNIELPVMVENNNQLPVMVAKNNQLPVMVDKNNQSCSLTQPLSTCACQWVLRLFVQNAEVPQIASYHTSKFNRRANVKHRSNSEVVRSIRG